MGSPHRCAAHNGPRRLVHRSQGETTRHGCVEREEALLPRVPSASVAVASRQGARSERADRRLRRRSRGGGERGADRGGRAASARGRAGDAKAREPPPPPKETPTPLGRSRQGSIPPLVGRKRERGRGAGGRATENGLFEDVVSRFRGVQASARIRIPSPRLIGGHKTTFVGRVSERGRARDRSSVGGWLTPTSERAAL